MTKEEKEYIAETRKELAALMEDGKPAYTPRELEVTIHEIGKEERQTAMREMTPKEFAEMLSF